MIVFMLTIRERSRILRGVVKGPDGWNQQALLENQTRLLTVDSRQKHCEPIANERQGSQYDLQLLPSYRQEERERHKRQSALPL